ncbi:MAG TPA: DNA mismatch repair endonuclease MutL [Candidatus Binatia bacterium]|nr:DNA mismatch repair endonuclease MutL [Candidatus Binatia bacterium]
MKIHILSDEVASRIAAGEVVERPASVVKELMENSLDAGATEIAVAIEKSGSALIRVIDNGEGMAPEDLALSVARHATSKLRSEADLFRIATLGFRGEALPSIASVSRMEIVSRPSGSETGYRIGSEGGKTTALEVSGSPQGTSVEIRDIFFNTPARRKFLKSPATELSHVCDVFNRLALAYPEVHFRLLHDRRVLADHTAVSRSADRLHQVFGREIAQGLIPFSSTRGNLTAGGHLSSVPTSFPNSRYLMTFVNRRFVRDKVLTHAVLQGYETLLMKGQYPAAVLFLEIPFAEVDVNVHPAKYEVKFRQQSIVHEAVAGAIRQKLKQDVQEASRKILPSASEAFAGVMETHLPYASRAVEHENRYAKADPFRISSGSGESIQDGFFSSLNILGQVLGCYLVCSSPQGLALIDQHAAHERVLFEKFRRELSGGDVQRQSLLIPQTLELTAGESMLLEQKLPVLARFGFLLEPFGPDAYALTAIPALLPEGDYRTLVRQMVSELAEVENSEKPRQRLEERLATMACHSVIRANRKLEMGEMRALLNELDQTEFATQCPHGRPVLIEFSRDQLDRLFKRVV